MTGQIGIAGREAAGQVAPGRARTGCRGGRVRIIDGAEGVATRPAGAVFDLSGPDLRIHVVDGARRRLITFGPFPEEDVIAIWRALCREADLAPMMKAHDETEALGCRLGRLAIGTVHARRRRPAPGRRRPRFLAKRKSTRLPSRPLVHREREIASGKGA